MHPMLNTALTAARSASKLMLRFIDRLDTVAIKVNQRQQLVSEVDLLAEQEISAILRAAYPSHVICTSNSKQQPTDQYCWLIDPLNGNVNFIHGLPHFALSIALRHGSDMILGLIYDPMRQEFFSACQGKGAHLNNRRLRVSNTAKLNQALVGITLTDELCSNKTAIDLLMLLTNKTAGLRQSGSPALDLAYLAAGRLDGVWQNKLNLCDQAAGTLLVREAGGFVSDQVTNQQPKSLVAANPKLYKLLDTLINKPILAS